MEPETAAARQGAVRLFAAMVAFTAIWLGLNLVFPGFQPSGIPTATTRLSIHAAILLGLWLGLSRTDFAFQARLGVWLAVTIPLTLWLGLIWMAAVHGAFQPRPGGGPPMLPLAILGPVAIAVPLLLRSRRIGTLLDAMPPAWLIALQLYRVFGGIFLVSWAQGQLSGIFAWPAGIGDVTTGLLALPIAYYLAKGGNGRRRAAIAWNVFGLIDLTIAVGIGFLTAPGPLQLIVPNIPSIGAGTYPTVMTPVFAVPSSIILHALSLRQLRRLAGNQAGQGFVTRPAPLPQT